jgi:hypothetical protein
MSANEELFRVVNKIGEVANAIEVKIRYFVMLGIVASSALSWTVFSVESAVWWNVLKVSMISMPALIWLLIWYVLGQLREAPELLAQLMHDEGGDLANINSFSVKEPDGLRGLLSAVREFQREDGLEIVFDTISGVTLISNPFFVLLGFLSMAALSILILIAPLLLLF